jgi:hypothetical protein
VPHFSLNYDINDFYQVMVDLFYSFWPILAAALGLALAGMLLSMIVNVFGRWIDDRRG